MSFWDNVKKFAQPYSDEEYDDFDEEMDEFEDVQETAPRSRRTSPFATAQDSDSSFSASAASATTSPQCLTPTNTVSRQWNLEASNDTHTSPW